MLTSILLAIVGAAVIRILPYINLTHLEKSDFPPFSYKFIFAFIFLLGLGALTDYLYCDGTTIPSHLNSFLIGAAAPSVLTNALLSFNKGNTHNHSTG